MTQVRHGQGFDDVRVGPSAIVSVIGTRPEAIKMAPLVRELRARGASQSVVLTGQHDGLVAPFEDVPTILLAGVAWHRDVRIMVERFRRSLHDPIRMCAPEIVLVQGDTSSALAGALAARDLGVAIGHVEAGLRSFDLAQPFPEEGNRIAIDRLAGLLFAPTPAAAANLMRDPQCRGTVHVTGNTGIDALFSARDGLPAPPEDGARKLLLLTCHRRENQGAGIANVCGAIRTITASLPIHVIVALHPNGNVRRAVSDGLAGTPHVTLIEPASHPVLVALMLASWAVMTDSGGLQEEAPALGRPVFVLGNVTERGEAAASMELVGTDPERIVDAVRRLLSDPARYRAMAQPNLPFGDGQASQRIATILETHLAARAMWRPADARMQPRRFGSVDGA